MRRLLPLLMAWALGAATLLAEASDRVEVVEGTTVTVPLPRQPQILGSEDPSIATVEVLPEGSARIHGRKVGETRIVGRDFAQVPIIIEVRVVPPPPPPPSPGG